MKQIFKKISGFTLVEIMVVIAIIGILTTLVMVSLDNTKKTARNARRLADIKQLQLGLKMYYNDNGFYPTYVSPTASLARNGVNYLLRIPQNPRPYNDNNCPDQGYQYTQLENGQRYSLTFCLGDKTDDLSGGPKTATSNGILDCPTGYIAVPGSATFETNDFCVMKYEAKCAEAAAPTVPYTSPLTSENSLEGRGSFCSGSKIPVSTPTGNPIGNVTIDEARDACISVGGHLMTNAEWMTLARHIEKNSVNWDGGIIGNSWLPRGHYDDNTVLADDSDPGSDQAIRTYTLFNQEVIWDLAGNMGEWIDTTCNPGDNIGEFFSESRYIEWDETSVDLTYERDMAGPSDPSWNDNKNGLGQYRGCTKTNNVMWRGGYTFKNNEEFAGLYHINMTLKGSTPDTRIGFRCVK